MPCLPARWLNYRWDLASAVHSYETQSPWPLSHHIKSIGWVKSKHSSSVAPAAKGIQATTRAARSQLSRELGDGDPLYLQKLFAKNVRLARNAMALSQEELADRASLDRTYISSIERSLRNVSIQNIQRLALALEVDPPDLLSPGFGEDSA